jgi:hypothetical protein
MLWNGIVIKSRNQFSLTVTHLQLPDIPVRLEQAIDFTEEDDNEIVLDLEVRGAYCHVISPSGKSAAVLNLTTFRLMNQCQEGFSLRFRASASPRVWYRRLETSKVEGSPPYSTVDVLVFGYQLQADAVAARLAKNRLYLQDPEYLPDGYQYQNPQALDLPDILPQSSLLPAGFQEQAAHDTSSLTPNNAELDFDSLLNRFSCSNGLKEVGAVAEVTSVLLR